MANFGKARTIRGDTTSRVREAARQAQIERDRVLEAALEAEEAAQAEETGARAKRTFWQRMKDFFTDEGL